MGVLRLLLAVVVVIYHAYPLWGYRIISGELALRSFFIISGFYMALILREKYPAGNYKLFITNRFLRIYPLYWFVCIVTLGASYFFITHFHYTFMRFLTDATILLRTDYVTLNPNHYNPMLVGPAWTLAVELPFYLIAPFLVRRRWFVLAATGILSLAIRYGVYHVEVVHGLQPTDRFFLSDLIFFVLGIFSYNMYAYKTRIGAKSGIGSYGVFIVMLAAILGYMYIPDISWRWLSGKEVIYYGLFTLSLPTIFRLFRHSTIDRFIGELSYPVYIWHATVILIASHIVSAAKLSGTFTILVLFCTIAVSWVSVRFVILPLDRFREKRVHSVRVVQSNR